MFEFLEGTYYYKDGFEGEISGYNPETNKVIIKGYDTEGEDENEKTLEFNFFDASIVFNIDYHKNWEHRLYEQLRWKNKTFIHVISTESGDSYIFEIHRVKTEFIQESRDKMTIINYVITFCDEVKGEILAKQYKMLDDAAGDSERDFIKWINEQIENVSEFNNTAYWNTFNAIVLSDAFNTDEEIDIMWKMSDEKFWA